MSAPNVGGLPPARLPEVAFAGRSNVGKSALLARLLGDQKLVRSSKTPGRTRLLNQFILDERIAVMDLPGYGYAKLSHTERDALRLMLHDYVAFRIGLNGVVLLLDGRREEVSELDRAMASLALKHNRALLLAITKADLLPKNQRLTMIRSIERSLGVPDGTAVLCSAKTGEGCHEIRIRLRELCEDSV